MKKLASFFVGAALFVPMLHATTYTTTITGYVYGSGTNSQNGDGSGNGKIFGTAAHLDGLPFKLVYTFDTSFGAAAADSYCSDMSIATSGWSGSSSTSNPGSATLSIYASDGVTLLGSFTVSSGATYTPATISSSTTRAYNGVCGSNENATWSVSATYSSPYDSGSSATLPFEAFPAGYPTKTTPCSSHPTDFLSCSGDWTTTISAESIYSNKPTPDRFVIAISEGGTDVAYASGYLTAASTTTTYAVSN